jgi:hypothetical protein
MNPSERGALMLVRFVAAALIGWAVVDVSLYVAVRRHDLLPVEILPCVLKTISFVVGSVILVKAKSIAEWLAEMLDL